MESDITTKYDSEVGESTKTNADIVATKLRESDVNHGNVIVWAGSGHVRMIFRDSDGYFEIPDGETVDYVQKLESGTTYVGLEQ